MTVLGRSSRLTGGRVLTDTTAFMSPAGSKKTPENKAREKIVAHPHDHEQKRFTLREIEQGGLRPGSGGCLRMFRPRLSGGTDLNATEKKAARERRSDLCAHSEHGQRR